jgi:hypothetical protein
VEIEVQDQCQKNAGPNVNLFAIAVHPTAQKANQCYGGKGMAICGFAKQKQKMRLAKPNAFLFAY